MLNLKISVAATILATTAAVSAGASYFVTKPTFQNNVNIDCPRQSSPAADNRGVPLGGPPLPTNQGKQW
jgi:capsular polysaccharide biosynthesis protein